MTIKAVTAAIKSKQDSEYAMSDFIAELEYKKKFVFEGAGEIELVAAETGYEGGPELIWVVFKVIGDDRLWKLTGHYSSWDVDDWTYGDLTEVEPKERVIVEFVPKR